MKVPLSREHNLECRCAFFCNRFLLYAEDFTDYYPPNPDDHTTPAGFCPLGQSVRQQVQQLKERMDLELACGELRPEQEKILQSLRRHWTGLCVFVEHPQVPMDHNAAERAPGVSGHAKPTTSRRSAVADPLHPRSLLIWQLNGSGLRLSHEHGTPSKDLAGQDAHRMRAAIVCPGFTLAVGAAAAGPKSSGG